MDPEKLQSIVDSVVTPGETVTEEVSPEIESQVVAEVVPATPVVEADTENKPDAVAKESLETVTPVAEVSADSAQVPLTEDPIKVLEESLSAEQAKVVTLAEEKSGAYRSEGCGGGEGFPTQRIRRITWCAPCRIENRHRSRVC